MSTGTARPPTRRRVSSVRQCRTAPLISRPNSWRTAPTPNRSRISRRCALRRWCASCSTGSSRSNGRPPRSCTTTRRRRSTPRSGPTCCSSRSCVRKIGPAGEDARHRLAVLRARRRRHRAAGGAGETRRDRAHPHQLARGVRRRSRCTRATRSAAGTCSRPVSGSTRSSRPQTKETGESSRPVRIRLVLRPACQDARRRQPPDLRRLVQLSTRARLGSTPKWVW